MLGFGQDEPAQRQEFEAAGQVSGRARLLPRHCTSIWVQSDENSSGLTFGVESCPARIYYDVTHAGTITPAARRRVERVLGRIVRSVSPEIAPIRCNHTQRDDRHPATWAKWRQRRTQALCVFRQNRRRRSPHPAPKSDATRQVLPQTWRHAAGFGIGHLESKLHSASAAGRRNRALVPIRAR